MYEYTVVREKMKENGFIMEFLVNSVPYQQLEPSSLRIYYSHGLCAERECGARHGASSHDPEIGT